MLHLVGCRFESCSPIRARDERFCAQTRFVIGELLRRRFHKITRRADQGAADAAIEGELGTAHGVNHHTGGIGRVPDFELDLAVEWLITESRAFETDVAPLASFNHGT